MQTISYFKHRRLHVELLFYNGLENTETVYEEILVRRKSKWEYQTESLRETNFGLIGVKEIGKHPYEALEDCLGSVLRLLDRKRVLFFSSRVDDLPHWKSNSFNASQKHHSLLLYKYSHADNGMRFHIQDSEIRAFRAYEYDLSFMRQAFDNSGFKAFTHYEFNAGWERLIAVRQAARLHGKFIESHEDGYELYDKISEQLSGHGDSATLYPVYQAFSILSGSRYFYSGFLKYMDYPSLAVEAYLILSEKLQVMVYRIYKGIVSGFIDHGALARQCAELKRLEQSCWDEVRKAEKSKQGGLL